MSAQKLYVIGNSHMDPIWLWRLRDGRANWLNTCRSVVRLMKQYPMLKFSRSSSVCYRWIEACDPELFTEIRRLVDAGRWEIVGGWVEQSDTIITPGESLLRQAEHAKRYFLEKFGCDVRIAYSVDSFGQNAGLPKLLNASGFERYVWMRPMEHEKAMPDLFRWRGDDGTSEVLSFRIRQAYCTMAAWTRKEQMYEWMDRLVAEGNEHQTFFFGLGDHGGGFYEQQIRWLLNAADRYNYEFSTLEHYFDVIEQNNLPVVTGEHTHHAPGCYSAVGDIKQWMAGAEKALFKAEKITLEASAPDTTATAQTLDEAWEELLFNYFHDVYPGTSTQAAYNNEIRNICGYASKCATDVLERGLGRYAAQARTDFLTEGGVLVWNPLPQPITALIRYDTFGDPNVTGRTFDTLIDAEGHTLPLQWCRAATSYGPGAFWGRMTATVDLPASGLRIFAYDRRETDVSALGFDRQKEALIRLAFPVLDDHFDTWAHGAKGLGPTLGEATAGRIEEIENGPVSSRLRVHYVWRNSHFHLDLFAYAGIPELELIVAGEWLEGEETLKLAWHTAIASGVIASGQADTVLERTPDTCEQPFIDWVAAVGDGCQTGFLAEALHSYDSIGTETLRLTLLRPVYYAEHEPNAPHGDEGRADVGQFEKRCWIGSFATADYRAAIPTRARERLWTAEYLEITGGGDGTTFRRDVWSVEPEAVVVTAQYVNADGNREFHLFNPTTRSTECRIIRNGGESWRGILEPGALQSVKL